jgi:hypothetical protein
MTRLHAIIGCACIALITTVSAAPADEGAETARLRRRVAELETQVERLQAKVRQLESTPQARPAPRLPSMPGSELRLEAPGHNWVPREFNGRTYYLVPCDAGAVSTETVGQGATVKQRAPVTLDAPTTKPSSDFVPAQVAP